jgi:hypothetical protein
MNVPEIVVVKDKLESLKGRTLIEAWELPYENLLTRLTAAIFFIDPTEGTDVSSIEDEFKAYDFFSCRLNTEKKISGMTYRLTFSQEQKEANKALAEPASLAPMA